MKLEFTMDLTCPWCYIGLKRLQLAMKAIPEEPFEISVAGFQLSPNLPIEGVPYRDNLKKFYKDAESLERNLARVTAIGQDVGATFAFDKNLITCHTLDAHRLLKYARNDTKMVLLEAMYEGVFSGGANLARPDELARIGAHAGVGEQSLLHGFLNSDELKQQTLDDFARSAQRPIITVPYLIINESFPVQAVHLPDVAAFCIKAMLG